MKWLKSLVNWILGFLFVAVCLVACGPSNHMGPTALLTDANGCEYLAELSTDRTIGKVTLQLQSYDKCRVK